MVTAASLSLLVIAWVAVGVAVTMALGLYGHLPSARDGVRRTRRAFLIGDGTGKRLKVTATAEDGSVKHFEVRVLLETPKEVEYFRHGGILPYVLRQLAA